MGFVRAKTAVMLPSEHGGYRHAGEEFEYDGPENENLEAVNKQPYYHHSTSEMKEEIAKRGLPLPPQGVAGDRKLLNDILVADDNKPAVEPITAADEVGADEPQDVYDTMSRDDLKAKLDAKGIGYEPNAKSKTLRNLLRESDANPAGTASTEMLGETATAEPEEHAETYRDSQNEGQ